MQGAAVVYYNLYFSKHSAGLKIGMPRKIPKAKRWLSPLTMAAAEAARAHSRMRKICMLSTETEEKRKK